MPYWRHGLASAVIHRFYACHPDLSLTDETSSMTTSLSRHGWPKQGTRLQRITRDGQHIAFTLAGVTAGIPIVVLHGGPGSGSQASALRLFDLTRFRLVLVDQRGAGMSTPGGGLRHNRTDRLIDDLEAIRTGLGIERWGVLGGSWGAALALAYAGLHPSVVTGVVIRGLFLTSKRELRRLFTTSRVRAPGAWQALYAAAQCRQSSTLLASCARALQAGVAISRQRVVALAWRAFENAVLASANSRHMQSPIMRPGRTDRQLIGKYQIQAHYLTHACWLGESRLLSLARRAADAGVPLFAVHGTRDPVCPPDNLHRLAHAVPTAHVAFVRAGHLASEPALGLRVAQAIEMIFC